MDLLEDKRIDLEVISGEKAGCAYFTNNETGELWSLSGSELFCAANNKKQDLSQKIFEDGGGSPRACG
jgi:hypothetical protein